LSGAACCRKPRVDKKPRRPAVAACKGERGNIGVGGKKRLAAGAEAFGIQRGGIGGGILLRC
jgi:hypothetical protein